MRFNCPKPVSITEWHRWWAWYPVRTGDNDCRWFEWVEAKAKWWGHGFDWEYRPLAR